MNGIRKISLLVLFGFVCTVMISCRQGADTGPTNYLIRPIVEMDLNELPACSLEESCLFGESCTFYDRGVARCYLEGREHEVVSCANGRLIVLASYPGQVACLP